MLFKSTKASGHVTAGRFNREPRGIRGRARRCDPFLMFRWKPEETLSAIACHCPVMPESGVYDPDQEDNRGGKAAERGGKSEDLPG